MIDTYDLYQDFGATVNTFQGGFIPPDTIFTRYINLISKELWEIGCREAEKSQEWRDKMRPFTVSENIITKKSSSYYTICNIPSLYERLFKSSIITVGTDNKSVTVPSKEINKGRCYFNEEKQDEVFKPEIRISQNDYLNSIKETDVDNVDLQRWDACLEHRYKKPTLKKPKMVQIDGVFRVAPRDVSVIVLYYFKLPKEATFIYTTPIPNLQTGAGGQIVYNQSASQPLEWGANMKNEFIIRLGEYYGIFTRDMFVTQASLKNKKQ